MMNKGRIEALSDGLFSVAMTVLIFSVKLPESLQDPANPYELMRHLWSMWPLFSSYYMSFAILGMYWMSHHRLFHHFAREASQRLTALNILFLCLIVLVPFSTQLIGYYPFNPLAIMVYGLNIIVISLVQYWMFLLTIHDPRARHESITVPMMRQLKLRMMLPPTFAVGGIILGFLHSPFSFLCFAIPVVINLVPGSFRVIARVNSKNGEER